MDTSLPISQATKDYLNGLAPIQRTELRKMCISNQAFSDPKAATKPREEICPALEAETADHFNDGTPVRYGNHPFGIVASGLSNKKDPKTGGRVVPTLENTTAYLEQAVEATGFNKSTAQTLPIAIQIPEGSFTANPRKGMTWMTGYQIAQWKYQKNEELGDIPFFGDSERPNRIMPQAAQCFAVEPEDNTTSSATSISHGACLLSGINAAKNDIRQKLETPAKRAQQR